MGDRASVGPLCPTRICLRQFGRRRHGSAAIYGKSIHTDSKVFAREYRRPLIDTMAGSLCVCPVVAAGRRGDCLVGVVLFRHRFAIPLEDVLAALPSSQGRNDLRPRPAWSSRRNRRSSMASPPTIERRGTDPGGEGRHPLRRLILEIAGTPGPTTRSCRPCWARTTRRHSNAQTPPGQEDLQARQVDVDGSDLASPEERPHPRRHPRRGMTQNWEEVPIRPFRIARAERPA